MPRVQADRLVEIGAALLRAAGASREEAEAVAVGCVNANLAGHDSHGIIAVPTYIDRIKAGHIVPGAQWTIAQESPATTVIDGHWGFGFHFNEREALTIGAERDAKGWPGTEIAATRVPKGNPRDREVPGSPTRALEEARAGLLGLCRQPRGCRVGTRVPVAPCGLRCRRG